MTIEEFYEILKEVKAYWSIQPGGLLRCDMIYQEELPECGNATVSHEVECCPITAVCLFKLGRSYPVGEVDLAGRQLHLSAELVDHIVEAADHFTFDMDPSTIYPALRNKLLEMVQLNEAERAH